MRGLLLGAAGILTLSLSPTVVRAQPDCRRSLLDNDARDTPVDRQRLAVNLVKLRDIGTNATPDGMPRAIALSPDGKQLAFQMRRADPDSNSYCIGMFVLDLAARGRPRLVDLGGDPIRTSYDNFRGLAGFPSGVFATVTPQWTSDGRSILFLKRVDGTTQVWRSAADGSASEMVTKSQDDVIDFQVDSDEGVHFQTAAGLRSGNRVIDREGRRGFHFDDRFFPASSSRPFVPAPVSTDDFVVTLPRAKVGSPIPRRSATAARQSKSSSPSMAQQGARTWISVGTGSLRPPRTLHVQSANGRETKCDDTPCTGRISNSWLTSAGAVRFFRREGWGDEATAIYEWMPGHSPKRLFTMNDVLESCIPVDDGVICLREGSVTPRTIARIELPSGRSTVLFDPNPEFGKFPIGQVERLHWKNREGLAVLGDLVLPVGYRPGFRYPLIVVQYETRGFLRGGTGDEYPIQLYAAHGYAVLSFNRPPDIGLFGSARTIEEAERADLADFADRRSVHSALEAGIAIAVARGVADTDRLGITGVSDGASTAQFALLNSNLFKAAAMSQCCWDPSMTWRVNASTMRYFRSVGYPGALSYDDPFWIPISIVSNVDRVRIPMLLQIADREYIGALPAFTALRERKAPSDLYVFPDETHIKWQPAHRLAIYNRSLAWFDFWLKGDRSPSTASIEESRHWNILRDERSGRLAPLPASGQSTPPRR